MSEQTGMDTFGIRESSRAPRERSNHLRLAVAAAMILASCASPVHSRIYRPEPMPASVSWTGPAPDEVTATTADGLSLRGYYWPPQTAGGDLILFFHGQSGNRYTAAHRAAPLASGGGLL